MMARIYVIAPSYYHYIYWLYEHGLSKDRFRYLLPDFDYIHGLRDMYVIVLEPTMMGNWSTAHILFLCFRHATFIDQYEFEKIKEELLREQEDRFRAITVNTSSTS